MNISPTTSHLNEFLENTGIAPPRAREPVIIAVGSDQVTRCLELLRSSALVNFEEWEERILIEHVLSPSRTPDMVALCAMDGDRQVMGVLLGGVGFRAQIAHLIVDPDSRTNGVGRMLLTAFEDHAKRQGCFHAVLTITADNNRPGGALDFYARCCYLPIAGEVTLEKPLGVH